MIIDWLVNPEETMKFAQGAQQEAITVGAQLTGPILNEVEGRLHTL
jgi:hypothetical protein